MSRILIPLPVPRDEDVLQKNTHFEYHFLSDSNYKVLKPSPQFNILRYIQECKRYIEKNEIQGILYTHDVNALVAAALHEECDLIGPSVKSMFLSTHKYYSRPLERKPISFQMMDLWSDDCEKLHYPCYVKSPCLAGSFYQYWVHSPKQMKWALQLLRKKLPQVQKLFYDFFSHYVDISKYPLCNKEILLVEEIMVDAQQYCVEGWVDNYGDIHTWAVTDHFYYPGKQMIFDHFSTPSRESANEQKKLITFANEIVDKHGIRNGFWNVEIWEKGDQYWITEVNGRAAASWYNLYDKAHGQDLYQAMSNLALGKKVDFQKKQKGKIGIQFPVITSKEGLARDLFDFEYAKTVSGLRIFVQEDSSIHQTHNSGIPLARFDLF